MSAPYARIELGDTRQFTITYSVAPPGPVLFALRTGSAFNALVASIAATGSSTVDFYAFHTFSGYLGMHAWQFVTVYSDVGPVTERGIVQVIATNTW